MSNIFGSPRRFREDDWWQKRDGNRLMDDMKARFEDDSFFKNSSYSSSETKRETTTDHTSKSTSHKFGDFRNGGLKNGEFKNGEFRNGDTKNGDTKNGDAKNGDADNDYKNGRKHSDDDDKEVYEEKDQFIVKVDVSKFPPEKVQVKVSSDNTLYIDAEFEEKSGERNTSRTLSRKFVLPNDVDIQTVQSQLSNGVLTICAPKKGAGKREEKIIPVKLI